MIDFHTHILPGIDDGSKDIRMTEAMLLREAAQGVKHIYATPHFYAHRRSVPQFLERREASFAQVSALLAERDDIPEVTAGAEVYYFAGMGKAAQLSELCVTGTNILLLEMPFEQWTSETCQDVSDILNRQRLKIVLAHIERYAHLQRDKGVWNEILSMPLTLQLNAGSFAAGGRRRRFCLKTLKEEAGRVLIGSDCHNMTDRAPNLDEAKAIIEKKNGTDSWRQIDAAYERLFG